MESRMREIRTYGLTRGKSHRRKRRGVGLYSTKRQEEISLDRWLQAGRMPRFRAESRLRRMRRRDGLCRFPLLRRGAGPTWSSGCSSTSTSQYSSQTGTGEVSRTFPIQSSTIPRSSTRTSGWRRRRPTVRSTSCSSRSTAAGSSSGRAISIRTALSRRHGGTEKATL